MRISDWSSDVCSSDLTTVFPDRLLYAANPVRDESVVQMREQPGLGSEAVRDQPARIAGPLADRRQGRCGDAVLDDQRDRRVRHALIGQRSALFLGAAGGNRIRTQDYLLVSDTQQIGQAAGR